MELCIVTLSAKCFGYPLDDKSKALNQTNFQMNKLMTKHVPSKCSLLG